MSNLHEFKAMLYSSDVIKDAIQLGKSLQKTEEYAKIAIKAGRLVQITLIEVARPKFTKPADIKALGPN